MTHICLVHNEQICCCSMGLKIKKKIILLSAAAVAAALIAIMLHCICARSACESWIWALSPAQANWTPLGPPGYSNWNRARLSSARLAVNICISKCICIGKCICSTRNCRVLYRQRRVPCGSHLTASYVQRICIYICVHVPISVCENESTVSPGSLYVLSCVGRTVCWTGIPHLLQVALTSVL